MKRNSMRNPQWTTWPGAAALGGIALGAMAMYLADPIHGKRRRSLAQQKMRTASEHTSGMLERMVSETGERFSAAQSRAQNMLRREGLDDEGLRVRARNVVDKLVRLPEEIGVQAEQGIVTLTGKAKAKDRDRIIRKLRKLPGIREVRADLKTSGGRSWFARRNGGRQSETMLDESATHSLKSAGNAVKRAGRHVPVGTLLTVAGLGYVLQSLSASMRRRSKTYGAERWGEEMHVQKSIEIQASPETVFNIWSKYDNFVRFIPYLVDVQSLSAQRSHWTVRSPAGVNLEWDALLTKYMEPSILAWKTEADAPLKHSGSVRFESSNGGTRVTIRMFYGPAAERSSSLASTLVGSELEQELEEGMERMKNFIEGRGVPSDMPQGRLSSSQVLH